MFIAKRIIRHTILRIVGIISPGDCIPWGLIIVI
ncbi:hypothetical protein LINPERHAP1_LOCUS39711 [Linum perenne]